LTQPHELCPDRSLARSPLADNTVADMDGVKKVLEGKSAIGALR
jgi:hypothetical protein